jgi:hypothetical protein
VVLIQAAGVDELVRHQVSYGQSQGREGMAEFVACIGPDALRTDLDVNHAADAVWALTEHRLFIGLVHERGWSLDEYANWLAAQLQAALLR